MKSGFSCHAGEARQNEASIAAMLLTDTGVQLVGHIEQQTDIPSLLTSFQRIVLALGMKAFCIFDPSNPKIIRPARRWGSTWPAEVSAVYGSRNFFSTDPCVVWINANSSPFRWSDTYASASALERRTLDEISAMCGKGGFVVPIHGPRGAVAGVSIGTDRYELSPEDEKALHLASLYLHARMNCLRAGPSSSPVRSLTPRERECLQWVAAGKTDWELSQILNISEQTAHGYIQNALTKLNARSRAQAVALAIQTAQIQP